MLKQDSGKAERTSTSSPANYCTRRRKKNEQSFRLRASWFSIQDILVVRFLLRLTPCAKRAKRVKLCYLIRKCCGKEIFRNERTMQPRLCHILLMRNRVRIMMDLCLSYILQRIEQCLSGSLEQHCLAMDVRSTSSYIWKANPVVVSLLSSIFWRK